MLFLSHTHTMYTHTHGRRETERGKGRGRERERQREVEYSILHFSLMSSSLCSSMETKGPELNLGGKWMAEAQALRPLWLLFSAS